MQAFYDAGYFKPRQHPEGMAVPDLVPVHAYHSSGVMGTHFTCVDDGGLLTDKSPVGKTFRLKNDIGLEAVLKIKEDRRNADRNGMDFDEMVSSSSAGMFVLKAEFLAEGFIEGYTASERKHNPEILIRLKNNKKEIFWLAYWADAEDFEAHRKCPVWQEYYAWADIQSPTEKQAREEILSWLKEKDS